MFTTLTTQSQQKRVQSGENNLLRNIEMEGLRDGGEEPEGDRLSCIRPG